MKISAGLITGLSVVALILGACSGKTHRIEQFPITVSPSDNPQEKIAALESEFSEARSNAVPILAPTWYQQAFTSLTEAKRMRDNGDNMEAIFRKAAEAKIEIDRANQVAQESRKIAKEALEARQQAILAQDAARKAGAVDLNEAREVFERADRALVEMTAAVEFNDMGSIENKRPQVVKTYQQAQRLSLAKEKLDRARRTIDVAKKQGAGRYAPQSLEIAQSTWNRANKVLMEEPVSAEEAQRLGKEADQYADRALRMTYEAKNMSDKNPEQVALGMAHQLENKENRIEALNERAGELREQAAKGQSAIEIERSIAEVRGLFRPIEADVLRDGSQVIVRLKGANFASGKAELPQGDSNLMQKVQQAIATLPAGRVTIEGHTDSTGSAELNEELSEKRAQTVKEYLVENGTLTSEKVDIVGKGSSEPLMTNNTKKGRAANRRIDLVVDLGGTSQQTAE